MRDFNALLVSAAAAGVGMEAVGARAALGAADSAERAALVAMARSDARNGATRADMRAYQELNAQLPDPFPANRIRVDEGHLNRLPHAQVPHGHVGPIDYIRIMDP